ncbi:hypothetical protein, partial [Escherichia coli]|uniref:hypothetical protein n=1 Tax=Escherichia coli TaxID=562 RepID=UPI0023E7BA18
NMSRLFPGTPLEIYSTSIHHLPYFVKFKRQFSTGDSGRSPEQIYTDVKKPTGEAGFFTIPDRTW